MEMIIKLKLKNKEITLTEEEARELKNKLNDLYLTKEWVPVPYPIKEVHPWYPYQEPWPQPYITCGGTDATLGIVTATDNDN